MLRKVSRQSRVVVEVGHYGLLESKWIEKCIEMIQCQLSDLKQSEEDNLQREEQCQPDEVHWHSSSMRSDLGKVSGAVGCEREYVQGDSNGSVME